MPFYAATSNRGVARTVAAARVAVVVAAGMAAVVLAAAVTLSSLPAGSCQAGLD